LQRIPVRTRSLEDLKNRQPRFQESRLTFYPPESFGYPQVIIGQRRVFFSENGRAQGRPTDPTGYEREEIIANRIQPLQERIQAYRGYLESLNGSSWEGFELPEDPDLSARFIGALLNSFYLRDEVYNRLSPQSELAPDQEPVQPVQIFEQVEKAVKQQKLRPAQRHRLACREAAEKIWKEDPTLTIEDMIDRKEITDACQGAAYIRKTIRNWVNDLCPKRNPGRPKNKKN
jgi:hypothetical protein